MKTTARNWNRIFRRPSARSKFKAPARPVQLTIPDHLHASACQSEIATLRARVDALEKKLALRDALFAQEIDLLNHSVSKLSRRARNAASPQPVPARFNPLAP